MSQHKRTKRTDAEWADLVKKFKASGQTQVAFCEEHGINVYSFRRRYQRSEQFTGKRRLPPQPAFTELIPLSLTPSVGLVVRIAEHISVECPPQMDIASIVKLVRGLTDDA